VYCRTAPKRCSSNPQTIARTSFTNGSDIESLDHMFTVTRCSFGRSKLARQGSNFGPRLLDLVA
jgi:hypothetical protein